MSGHEGSKKAILAAFLANLGIAIAKFVGFLITGAASMMAESLHSFADTGNQALLLLGGRRGSKKADDQHEFGYGRERYFWAFVVALVLFSLGGLFALYEGIQKLQHPHEIESIEWAYAILIFAVVLEGLSLRTAVHEARPLKGKQSWWAFIRNSKSPELPVVLLEDTGAELGLIFALAGLTIGHITGNARWDAVGSLAIGILLVAIAVILAIEMKSLLTGESATPEVEDAIRKAALADPVVLSIVHLRTEHLGPDELLVAIKVVFAANLTGDQIPLEVNRAEQRIRAAAPGAKWLFVEPGVASEQAEVD